MNKIKIFWSKGAFSKVVLIASACFVGLCCLGVVVASVAEVDTNIDEVASVTESPVEVSEAQPDPTSINEPNPTAITQPDPTATAEPTATTEPLPELPEWSELAANSEAMTDAQWNNYAEGLVQNTVTDWQGQVIEVDEGLFGGFDIWVDIDNDVLSTADVFIPVSEQQALEINKGSTITFNGIVDNVDNLFGLSVRLEEGAEYVLSE